MFVHCTSMLVPLLFMMVPPFTVQLCVTALLAAAVYVAWIAPQILGNPEMLVTGVAERSTINAMMESQPKLLVSVSETNPEPAAPQKIETLSAVDDPVMVPPSTDQLYELPMGFVT